MPSGYRINILPTTELHRREIELRIQQLRAVPNPNEIWFVSRNQIIEYLNDVGVRNGYGHPITRNTLKTWHRKRGFPLFIATNKNRVVTSNLMIQAWLWSYRALQASRDWKPHTKDVLNVTAYLDNAGA